MASATVQSLTKFFKDFGLKQITDEKKMDGNFLAPKSATGKEFVIYLPEQYGKKDRTDFLKVTLAATLKDFKPKFVSGPSAKSTAGQLSFTGSQVYVIAKLLSAKGGGGNKGIDFEKNLEEDFKKLIAGKTNFMYKDFIINFKNSLKGDTIVSVESVGGENTPRPLAVSGKELYVSVRGGTKNENIGQALADLRITTSKRKVHNLSLKYGSTVTFFNSGVKKVFSDEDFKKGKFDDPVAKELISLFGIDPIRFRNVFMNYKSPDPLGKKGKSEKDEVKVKVNKEKLEKFIRTVIGYGYVLVHEHNDHSVDFYNIDEKFLEKAAKPITDVTIQYPVGGSAKRIDMLVETAVFKLKFNIRNKQGGITPSHIMCDYTIKH
jgi:hypothetical protein